MVYVSSTANVPSADIANRLPWSRIYIECVAYLILDLNTEF